MPKTRSRLLMTPVAILISITSMPCGATGWTYTLIAQTGAGNRQGFVRLDTPVINDRGEVAFAATAFVRSTGKSGVWLWKDGVGAKPAAIFPYVRGGEALAATTNRSGDISFTNIGVNAQNYQVSNIVTVTKTGVTTLPTQYNGTVFSAITYDGDVLVASGGQLFRLSGKATTLVNPGYCYYGFSLASNGAGQVVYPGGKGACGSYTLYVTNSARGTTRFRAGTDTAEGQVGGASIAGGGKIAYTGTAALGQSGSNVSAVYTATNNGAISLVNAINNGTCSINNGPPGGIGSSTAIIYDATSINAKGTVAVGSVRADWIGTTATYSGAVSLNGDVANATVFSPGLDVAGCVVKSADIGAQAINDSGQIVASLACQNFAFAIAIATPVP